MESLNNDIENNVSDIFPERICDVSLGKESFLKISDVKFQVLKSQTNIHKTKCGREAAIIQLL